jgi:hypothetical protein
LWIAVPLAAVLAIAIWFFFGIPRETRVTPNELTKIFADGVSAEAFRQLERPITTTGEVRSINIEEGVPVVDFRTAQGWVRAELPKGEAAKASRLQQGDVATVTCQFLTDNNGNGGVRLHECRLSE